MPHHCSATSAVSDSGSETGVASRAYVWPDAVSLTAHSALTSSYSPNQVRYSNVCAVRDEEAAGSNPATPTSSQATSHHGTWPFLMPYSSKVQQRLQIKTGAARSRGRARAGMILTQRGRLAREQ